LLNLILIQLKKENINVYESSCKEHYLYIIKLLLKSRIYKACKWIKAEENTTYYSYCNKKLPKLRILEHTWRYFTHLFYYSHIIYYVFFGPIFIWRYILVYINMLLYFYFLYFNQFYWQLIWLFFFINKYCKLFLLLCL
jgi:hypothetical protein